MLAGSPPPPPPPASAPARARPRAERLASILERIATQAPLDATLDEIVGLIEADIPGAIGSMLLLDADGVRLRCASVRGLPPAYSARIDGIPSGEGVGACGTAVFRREPVFVSDTLHDPLWAAFRDEARTHGLRACWSTPILSRRRGRVLGTFAVYFRTPALPTAAHREALANAESLACIAIEADAAVRELRESDARLRMFVDHATDGFFVVDAATGAVVEVNAQACTSLGYERSDLIGATTRLFDQHVTSDDVNDRLAVGDSVTFESRHRRKDGAEFPVEIRIRPFVARGQTYHLALVRDITARRQLEEQLHHAQKMEAIGRLAGGVAHDFNNLLTVINGYTDVLLEELPPATPSYADLAMIREAGERAAALTAQLLAFGRRTIISPKPLDLNDLVERLAKLCRHLIGEHIVLDAVLKPNLGTVLADAGQIEQVVMNLVVNARDAMPRGGTLTIATSDLVTEGTRWVCLSVADTGVGMTDEVRARVFEPFFTTKPQGEGSGLGLATAFGIVEQANGKLQVETKLGKGTTFRVILPAINAAAVAAPPVQRDRPRGTETVLLTEDEDAVRRLTQRALELHGYRVLTAKSGADALALERAHPGQIHLLITDVVMPGLGGRELVDLLAPRRPELRILYMSGYTNDEVVRHGVTVGGDCFLQKPFTPQTLLSAVRTALDAPTRAAAPPRT